MEIITATNVSSDKGRLTKIVENYCDALGELAAAGVSSPADWNVLDKYIATHEFKRVGAYLEELDWSEYTKFLTSWSGGTKFEMTIFRITEAGRLVVQEIEERHYREDDFIRKNVVAIYAFNSEDKIVHLDIYEQAKDSGRWIIEAAEAATVS